jgi:hypothetical protein
MHCMNRAVDHDQRMCQSATCRLPAGWSKGLFVPSMWLADDATGRSLDGRPDLRRYSYTPRQQTAAGKSQPEE